MGIKSSLPTPDSRPLYTTSPRGIHFPSFILLTNDSLFCFEPQVIHLNLEWAGRLHENVCREDKSHSCTLPATLCVMDSVYRDQLSLIPIVRLIGFCLLRSAFTSPNCEINNSISTQLSIVHLNDRHRSQFTKLCKQLSSSASRTVSRTSPVSVYVQKRRTYRGEETWTRSGLRQA